MTGILTIEVLAGMANRLRALISAICLAEDLDRNLHVIWSANDPACMARFESLWDRSTLPPWVRVDMGPLEEPGVMVLSPMDMEEYVKRGDTRPIRSYGHFHQSDMPRWLKYLRKLQPSVQCAYQLNTPFLTNTNPIVGVHIRRGDHTKARLNSPLAPFLEAMAYEPPETKFLVATDDPLERRAIEAAFPGRTWFPATTLSRMTQKGMQDAVLDFIGLSRCRKIFGSYDSSFSQLASLYGNKPIHVITQKESAQ